MLLPMLNILVEMTMLFNIFPSTLDLGGGRERQKQRENVEKMGELRVNDVPHHYLFANFTSSLTFPSSI